MHLNLRPHLPFRNLRPTHKSRHSERSEGPLYFAFAVAVAFALALPAQAQSTIHGKVLDPLGAPVPNAEIVLHAGYPFNGPTEARGAKSGDDGSYTFTLPAHCPCTFFITAQSFAETIIPLPANTDHIDLTLATPTRSDEITVTTGTPTPLAQSGAPISVLTADADFPHTLQIAQPLSLIPGVQLTTSGQVGGATSLFLRGGNSDFTKVLIDGVPVNDIGSLADLSTLASDGISRIEVLRQPSSALYGSDAVAGVVSLSTARGLTPLPLFTYAVDGGNLNTLHQAVSAAGARAHFDYDTGVAVLQTSNNEPNDQFRSASTYGNYGFIPDSRTDIRFTFRHLGTNAGNPNAILFYGVPDFVNQFYQETFLNGTAQNQTTPRWHNLVRYGHQYLNYTHTQYATDGTPNNSLFATLGNQVTIHGANGYSVSGQAQLDYFGTYPSTSVSATNRGFLYAQSDYRVSHYLTALGAFQYESENGVSTYSSAARTNYSGTIQFSGDAASRLFYVLGTGIENNQVYGKAVTPRASVAYYAFRPTTTQFLSGTKLHASFGKGIEEPSVAEQVSSLYGTLQALPGGAAIASKYGIQPLGGEYSRTYDAGVEQQFGNGRGRVNLSWFHNQFNNILEYVYSSGLVELGVPPSLLNNATYFPYGASAYVNSLAYRAEGAELESEFRLTSHLFARAGYTYLDARVQRSFSSDALSPNYNTSFNFPNIPIGNYGPLDGARPFRRAPHSGYFALQYTHDRFNAQLNGALVGRRDDSTFLGGSDPNYGNSLLLPNRNLDGAYQNLTLSADYRITHRVTTYASLQNLLNESYQEAFGFPALPITIRGGFKLTFGGESWHLN